MRRLRERDLPGRRERSTGNRDPAGHVLRNENTTCLCLVVKIEWRAGWKPNPQGWQESGDVWATAAASADSEALSAGHASKTKAEPP